MAKLLENFKHSQPILRKLYSKSSIMNLRTPHHIAALAVLIFTITLSGCGEAVKTDNPVSASEQTELDDQLSTLEKQSGK